MNRPVGKQVHLTAVTSYNRMMCPQLFAFLKTFPIVINSHLTSLSKKPLYLAKVRKKSKLWPNIKTCINAEYPLGAPDSTGNEYEGTHEGTRHEGTLCRICTYRPEKAHMVHELLDTDPSTTSLFLINFFKPGMF